MMQAASGGVTENQLDERLAGLQNKVKLHTMENIDDLREEIDEKLEILSKKLKSEMEKVSANTGGNNVFAAPESVVEPKQASAPRPPARNSIPKKTTLFQEIESE